jgi:hypothetical protein
MRIPHSASAIVPAAKLQDYLLSETHPIGRYKADFFRRLGFERTKWQQLEIALRALLSQDAEETEATEYGQKYLTRGPITGPTGATARVEAVWIILTGEQVPRFVTAYPKE